MDATHPPQHERGLLVRGRIRMDVILQTEHAKARGPGWPVVLSGCEVVHPEVLRRGGKLQDYKLVVADRDWRESAAKAGYPVYE